MLFAFDCDGVLVDSEVIASEVDADMLTKIGFPITAQDVTRRFAGLTAELIFRMVEDELGYPLPEDFHAEQKAELDRRLAKDLKGIPGVGDMLDRIDGPRCVCSNSSGERLRLSLQKAGTYDRFRPYIFSSVEVGTKEPKPAPNVYSFAAREFDVDPREMLVVEDTVFGIRAAKAAGARVVGFVGGRHTWPGHADMLTDAGAETVVKRWEDFPAIADAVMSWDGMPD